MVDLRPCEPGVVLADVREVGRKASGKSKRSWESSPRSRERGEGREKSGGRHTDGAGCRSNEPEKAAV